MRVLLSLLLFWLWWIPIAAAASFAVNTTADAVDVNVGDGLCATADGACSLRAAVQEANEGKGADAITLPAGQYVLAIPRGGDTSAAHGDLDVTDSVTITGAGADLTVIDGGGIDRVFAIRSGATAPKVEIAKVTIRNGRSPRGEDGGGILNEGTLTLTNAVVTDNRTTADRHGSAHGGGIFNRHHLTLSNAVLSNNTADDGGGGLSNRGSVGATNTTVSGNQAPRAKGGGIENAARMALVGCTVSGNSADEGGGIASQWGPAAITQTTISDNSARLGGGIANIAGTLTFANTTVSGNSARTFGGGLLSHQSATTALNNATIAHNSVHKEGARTGGGGIAVEWGGTVRLSNTILAGNSDDAKQSPDCMGTLSSAAFNLVQDLSGCTLRDDKTGNITARSPNLGALADNGGPTRTHALLPGSLAIDAGNPDKPGGGVRMCEAKDQRGTLRPAGGRKNGTARCDIGAVERQSTDAVK